MVRAGGVRQEGKAANPVTPVGSWSFIVLRNSGDSGMNLREGTGVFIHQGPMVIG